MPAKPKRTFFVYILASKRRTLYTGVTNDLQFRLHQHRTGLTTGFASKYQCLSLAYFESHGYVNNAIAREKEIKGWIRKKKIALIESQNPDWKDLSEGWERGWSE